MSETAILSRDAILAADDLPRETVEVPEWGGAVVVQGLTSRQRDLFEASIQKRRAGGKKRHKDQRDDEDRIDLDNFRAKLVVRCVVDQQGSPYLRRPGRRDPRRQVGPGCLPPVRRRAAPLRHEQ